MSEPCTYAVPTEQPPITFEALGKTLDELCRLLPDVTVLGTQVSYEWFLRTGTVAQYWELFDKQYPRAQGGNQ